MFRTQSLLIAALLMTSATAFAQDTPDPSTKAEPPQDSQPITPSEVEGLPSTTPPPAAKLPPGAGESAVNPDAPPATAPGEENKGKPPVAPQ